MSINKYSFYEQSTQCPEVHITIFETFFKEIRKRSPHHLREDFCGTFLFCCEWVKQNPKNTALGLDIDPEPLAYGKKTHYAPLKSSEKKRLEIKKQNVLQSTPEKKELIIACNFSFNIFKTRELLKKYFKSCLRSLDSSGIFVLEMAGGPGMIQKIRETKTVKTKRGKFRYCWDQKSFNPITRDALYGIHFKPNSGKWIKDVFTYDWRLWTIPEVRELLQEAGFSKSIVYWEASHKGEGTGEYFSTELGDNDFAWISYVVGVR